MSSEITCGYEGCDKEFTPSTANHRYCCDAHRKRQRRRDRRDGMADTLTPVESGQADVRPKPRKAEPKPPRGWEARAEFDAEKGLGTATTTPLTATDPDEAELLTQANLDPAKYRIVGKRRFSTWQSASGEWRTSHKFDYEARGDARDEVDQLDLDALVEEMRDWTPEPYDPPRGDDAFVVCLSDWQIGKGEGGGTPETLRTLRRMIADVDRRIDELRAAGKPLDTLYVFCLGDMVEGCGNCWYPMGSFTQDLNRRDQVKLVRRLLRDALKAWAPKFRRVVVAAVPGNHGENRTEGRAYTNFADNDDVAVVEMVAEILAENPAFDHVEYAIPEDELSMAVEVAGVPVGLAHGHQFGSPGKKPAGPQRIAGEWWTWQEFGIHAVKDCMLLFSGHFHHFSVVQHGPRTHIQAPTCDGGSKWFADTKGMGGMADPTGTLTLRVHPAEPGAISDLQIVAPRRTVARVR